MTTLKFKTNIQCGGCLAAVQPVLDQEASIHRWEVDLEQTDKVLTIETDSLDAADVQRLLAPVGYQAEPLKQEKGVWGKLFKK